MPTRRNWDIAPTVSESNWIGNALRKSPQRKQGSLRCGLTPRRERKSAMNHLIFSAMTILLTFGLNPAVAADLTTVERTIAKEPAYKNKPKYCLCVFGPEAKTRVWLVLDGNVLYVDRNGNGDLTEKDERVTGMQAYRGLTQFAAGAVTLPEGESQTIHLRLDLSTYEGSPMIFPRIVATIDRTEWTSSLYEFADRPKIAPIVHFNGLLTFVCLSPPNFVPGKTTNLTIFTGTAGLGEQAFAWRSVKEMIGVDAQVRARFEFPNKDPDARPFVIFATLVMDQCTGSGFSGSVRVPDEAALGQAKVFLRAERVAEWAVSKPAPTTLLFPIVRSETK
jgi:hypothetical protein